MAGASSWIAIAQWSKTAPQALGICGVSPSAATFRRVLAAVDIAAVEAALTTWVTGRRAHAQAQRPVRPAAEGRTVLAVDGKTLRGSVGSDGQPTKLMCVYDHAHRLVLTQTAVVAGDEITAFTAALSTLPFPANVLVTADALHCQRAHADFLAARGGHYLFTVTGNQPLLRQALMRLPWAHAPGCRRRGRGHGRTESPLDQYHRPGRHAGPGPVPARPAGDQGRPPAPGRCRQALGGDRLRAHLPGLPRRRPATARRLAAGPLGDREQRPPRPRRDPA